MSALLTPALATLLHAAEATEEHHEAINHWIVGGIAFAILIALLIALVSFGGGREHS